VVRPGPNDALAALRLAAGLARRYGLRLVVAHVTHTTIAVPQLAPASRVPMLAEQVVGRVVEWIEHHASPRLSNRTASEIRD
jgi:hypothetical protein